jgi:long-chain acyl-CoA synthetase
MLPNLLQYPVVLFGILRAGLTVVNVNPLYTARELEVQLKDSGAKAIIVLENFARDLQEVLARHGGRACHHARRSAICCRYRNAGWSISSSSTSRRWCPPGRSLGAIPSLLMRWREARSEFTPSVIGHDDIAFLQYTGGTTGIAKGAMLTHGNMLANLEQVSLWISASFKEGARSPLPRCRCTTSSASPRRWVS